MDERETSVPRIDHQTDMARMERGNRRLFAALLVAIAFCAYMTYLYVDLLTDVERVEVTQEVETGEGSAYVAGVGDVNYGESKADSQGNAP